MNKYFKYYIYTKNQVQKFIKKYSEIYSNIEIEIIISQQSYGKFINIQENEKSFYHIYFNNNKNEIKNKY